MNTSPTRKVDTVTAKSFTKAELVAQGYLSKQATGYFWTANGKAFNEAESASINPVTGEAV